VSTLYLARLLEAETVTLPAGQPVDQWWTATDRCEADAPAPGSPYGWIVVECVTVHPDAGMPPTFQETGDGGDERRFVARLLADARQRPEPDDDLDFDALDFELDFDKLDAEVDRLVLASRRLQTIDIQFDDDFWTRHRDTWWACQPVVADSTLRAWLRGPSDGAPYQVAVFEALTDPTYVPALDTRPFTSAAYW